MTEKQFYVYVYYLLDGRAIYVGKGSGDRFRAHITSSKKNHIGSKIRKLIKEEKYTLYPEFFPTENEEAAFALEKELIKKFGRLDTRTGTLFNLTDGGEGGSGVVASEETRRKISEANRGKKHSEEAKQKLREFHTGRGHTEETKQKLREKNSGEKSGRWGAKMTEEQKKALSERMSITQKGKIQSEELKLKRGVYRKGEDSPSFGTKRTEESKKKMSEAALGKVLKDSTKEKIRGARLGKKSSEETKARLKEAVKARFELVQTCPHCGKEGRGPGMKAHHFDRCKRKSPEEPGFEG